MTAPASTTPSDRPTSQAAGTGDINALLAYAKAASAQALRAKNLRPVLETRVPAELLPDGYTLGDLVPVESLPPAYRAFAESLGATQVRPIASLVPSEADFQLKARDGLDASQAQDTSYQAARDAGQVTVRRASELVAELGDDPAAWQSFALYRGQDYLGIGGSGAAGGIGTPAFDTWRAAAEATGTKVVSGGYGQAAYIGTWSA